MRSALFMFASISVVLAGLQTPVAATVVLASDDYESSSGVSFGGTSGTGFGAHTSYGGSGNIFWQSGSPKIDGAGSLGTYSNGNYSSFYRTFTDTSALGGSYTMASFDISLRFAGPNSTSGSQDFDFKGFNLKTAVGSGFGSNELISVGMTQGNGNNKLLITGSTVQSLDFGTVLQNQILDVNVLWNVLTGAYTVKGNIRSQSPMSVSGTLQNPGSYIPNAIAFHYSDAGGSGNDLILDNLALSAVPEASPALAIPSAVFIAGLVFAARCGFRRRLAAQAV